MVTAICIDKVIGNDGDVEYYVLQNKNNIRIRVSPENLRLALFTRQLNVTNLGIRHDGHIVDTMDEYIDFDKISEFSSIIQRRVEIEDGSKIFSMSDEIIDLLSKAIGLPIYSLDYRSDDVKFYKIHRETDVKNSGLMLDYTANKVENYETRKLSSDCTIVKGDEIIVPFLRFGQNRRYEVDTNQKTTRIEAALLRAIKRYGLINKSSTE